VAGLSRADQLRLIGVDGILLVLIVQNIIFIGVPLVRTRLIRREPLASIGLQAPRPLRLTLIGLGLGVLLLVGNAVIGALFASAGIRQNQADQYPLFAGDYLGQALFMLGAAVIVPIGEEVLFRGYVFHTLRRMFADARWGLVGAYLLSSAVFGVAHSLAATEGVVALIIPTMLLGLALAWVVNRTGSLIPAIIAHAMNNGVALLALVTCINNPGMCPGL
jgi:membrane protease YdiL (CAAX protease family)